MQELERNIRKSRKIHRCDYCRCDIAPKTLYEQSKYVSDGVIYEWKTHIECSYIATQLWDYADPIDGMDSTLFTETCSDFCKAFVCPKCQKWKNGECTDKCEYCIHKIYDFLQKYQLFRAGVYTWKCRLR